MMNRLIGCCRGLCGVHGIYDLWLFFNPRYVAMAFELLCSKAKPEYAKVSEKHWSIRNMIRSPG